MPYHNMPESMWGKMDDCVKKVQAQGHDKQGAIAICYTSLMGKERQGMPLLVTKPDGTFFREAELRELGRRSIVADLAKRGVMNPTEEEIDKHAIVLIQENNARFDREHGIDNMKATKASDQPGDYLIVEDREKPTTWHLQVRDNGTPDHRLMGAAHAALMSPNGYRGNKYEGPNKTEAIAKLRRLYEQEGLTWPEAKAVKDWGMAADMPMAMPGYGPTTISDALAQEQAQEQAEQLRDAFGTFQGVVNNIMYSPDIPDKGAAIEKEAGAFRQWFDSIISGAQQAVKSIAEKVGARHSAADQEHLQTIHDAATALGAACKEAKQSAFTLFKDASGAWHWLAIATNNRRDSDHPAQILTDAAHKEFLQYLDGHPEAMPELWHWHTPGTRWGKAETVDYVDGFMVYAGTVDAGHEAEAEKLAQTKEIGVSHGFIVLNHDAEQEHIKKYRTFEISPLPLSAAANRWTSFSAIHKEVGMPFAEQKRAHLVRLLGEERVKMLETDLSAANKTLDALGVEAKAETTAPDPKPEEPQAAPEPEPKPEEPAWFLSDMKPEEFKTLLQAEVKPMLESQQQANVTAIVTATKDVGDKITADLAQIVKAQADLDKRLKALEGLTPRGYRATQDPATAVDASKAQKAAPGPDGKENEFLSWVMGHPSVQ